VIAEITAEDAFVWLILALVVVVIVVLIAALIRRL
jgi:hypothetical protein